MAIDINIPSQVKTYTNLAAFPVTGAVKTIFIAEDTNKTYRWTGTAYVEVSASASGITIGTTAIASGVVGRVLFEGAGNVVQESSSLFWDDTFNRLGIGTSSPTQPLTVNGRALIGTATNIGSGTTLTALQVSAIGTAPIQILSDSSKVFGLTYEYNSAATSFYIFSDYYSGAVEPKLTFGTYTNKANQLVLNKTGNIGINTTTDAGFKLDVNGTARVQTSLEVAGASGVTFGGGASVLSYSGNILNIGNSASWNELRLFAGAVQKFSQTSTLTTISNTTINLSTATVQLAGVNALTYSGTDIRIGSVSAGFNSLSMYVAGSERARIASTGNLLINTTTDAGFRLDVNGTARFTGQTTYANNMNFGGNSDVISPSSNSGNFDFLSNLPIRFLLKSGSVERMRIVSSTGNILINTTTDVASSKLTIESTTQGFLPPRMTTTQKNAIASPAVGLMVYDTTLNLISVYNGTSWITL